ncbi:Coiled-coil domain containing protein 127 [Dissostichus eleginoides]|uniref:Coiled-coil domain containing protein 127 n=1 Tax=Dissostichus eleginoides TaxID=100907 RepID=A0AAD9EVK9_DISEL|nr:Coiled-coil domain containing protein 127 [Dissostichus eleginoides]
MNNQNDPWDIGPDPRGRGAGAGDGHQLNYPAAGPNAGTGCISLDLEEGERANNTLKELENQLLERQHVYCSCTQSQYLRLEMEKNMLIKVIKDPVLPELDLESDLNDIFKRDTHWKIQSHTK